jgi:tight adherence protein C
MDASGDFSLWLGSALGLVVLAALVFLWDAHDYELIRRVRNLVPEADKPQTRRQLSRSIIVDALSRLGEGLRGRLLSEKDAKDLGRTLASSGYGSRRVLPLFVASKLLCLFAVPPLVFGVLSLVDFQGSKPLYGAMLSVVIGLMAPNWCVGFLRNSFLKSLRIGLPDALDLLVVCAEAGLGLEMAIDRVAGEMQKFNRPIAAELAALGNELRILPDRKIALSNMAERSQFEGLKRLAATFGQTLQYGTPLAQGLRVLSAEMRRERVIKAEERAVRLPTLLILPMILFILPCLFIVLIGPAALQLMSTFGSLH